MEKRYSVVEIQNEIKSIVNRYFKVPIENDTNLLSVFRPEEVVYISVHLEKKFNVDFREILQRDYSILSISNLSKKIWDNLAY
jgi:hypothetical protein